MKSLIVNADDFGWTDGVNKGIADAHRNGIVTSTSLLANSGAFEPAVAIAHSTPDLGVGVHLNLSDGPSTAPVDRVASLVDRSGNFTSGPERLLLRRARQDLVLEEVELEWDSQIQKVARTGISPTHLDGHKHVHMLPGLFEIAVKLAKRHGIGAIRVSHEASFLRAAMAEGELHPAVVLKQGVQARGLKFLARDARQLAERCGIATTDYFCGVAHTGQWTHSGLLNLLKSLPDGITELMCHPGYVDADLEKSPTRLQASRREELDILTDTQVRNLVASQGIRLIDYSFAAARA